MPPKLSKSGKPLEKAREDWFFRRTTYPLRDAAPTDLESYWENQHRFSRASNAEWQQAGPFNYSGRVTSLAADPVKWNSFIAGTGGGLWRTNDRGATWKCIWPNSLNQSVGAVAWNPDVPGLLICATGEGNPGSGTYPGSGIYSSADEGATWLPLYLPERASPNLPAIRAQRPRRVAGIAFGPFVRRQQTVAYAAVSWSENLVGGLYIEAMNEPLRAVDAWGQRPYNCHSVVFHPHEPGVLYAAIEPGGSNNGIWRSRDVGRTWKKLDNGLPRGETCGRISLAISTHHPEVLYALVASRTGGILGVFRTGDGGASWTHTFGPSFAEERQMNYNNVIALHPWDDNYVICGGVDLHLTRDGGATWSRISTGRRGSDGERLPVNFVHYDQHALTICPDGWIYAGHDGGISVSNDGGATWTDRSAGLATAMFYDVDVSPVNSRIFGGGAQDAGSLIAGVSHSGKPLPPGADHGKFTRVLGGDGGWMVFDPHNPLKVFGATASIDQKPFVHRHDAGEVFCKGHQLGGWKGLDAIDLSPPEKHIRSLTILAVQPAHGGFPQRLWLATNRLWCTEDDGDTWRPRSRVFDGSPISAINFTASNPALGFAGTSLGGIFRTRDGGRTWSSDLAGPEIPHRMITQIEEHPANADIVVASVASSGLPAAALNGDDRPFGHLFRTTDGGDTWQDVDRGSLPNVVYNGLAFESHPPYRLFLGGDAGVWVIDGESVFNINATLPNVIVSDLVYHHKDRLLTAATYGRGIWRLPLPPRFQFQVEDPQPGIDPALIDIPAAGLTPDLTVPPPRLLAPNVHAVCGPDKVKFQWAPVVGATGYIFEFLHNGQPSECVYRTSPSIVSKPRKAGRYEWRVWALLTRSRHTITSERRAIRCSG